MCKGGYLKFLNFDFKPKRLNLDFMYVSSISQKKLWSSREQNHWIQPPSLGSESSVWC